ncbi:MAG: HNH endonuclease [Chloroflexi bacterium]|nr:MAG: HNH endonuclease [Chloroflexota bacterium]
MRSVGGRLPDRLRIGGGARAVVLRRCGGACERCGLEWPWALYLFRVDETGPAAAANLVAICAACSDGRAGAFAPLLSEPSLRERLREANNRRTGAARLTPARRRRLIAERGGCCQTCGISGAERQLDVHHLLGVLRGGDDSEANLMVLCFACHRHLQPCAAGCGRWARKPASVCRRYQVRSRLQDLYPTLSLEEIKARHPSLMA